MSGEPDSQVLRDLRRIDKKLDPLADGLGKRKTRMTTLEAQVAKRAATEASHYASLSMRMDRLEARSERIERRLDRVEHPQP